MPGVRNMLVGAFVLVIGIAVTAGTWAAASDGGLFVVAFGAILAGAIQFLRGASQFVGYNVKGRQGKAKMQAKSSATAIVRAMLTVSIADGSVDESEIATIRGVFRSLFSSEISEAEVREAADRMLGNRNNIWDDIRNDRALIPTALVPVVFKAAYLVAAADGVVGDGEIRTLSEIAGALGMREDDVKRAVGELRSI